MADYEAVRAEYSGHPHVYVQPLGAAPAESYRVTYRLRGLELNGDRPVERHEHVVDIQLPLGYPREQPYCVPRTPVFHPNINPDRYCIADYWAAGQSLVDVIAKIGDMIQYRIYNTKSPLDAVAANWAGENPQLFPIGNVELGQPEIDVGLGSRGEQAVQGAAQSGDIALKR